MSLRLTLLALSSSLALAACGGAKTAPATSTTSSAPAAEATPAAAPAPTIGPDECCCPFASAEEVQFNVMTKADCDAAGTGCVEADRCVAAK